MNVLLKPTKSFLQIKRNQKFIDSQFIFYRFRFSHRKRTFNFIHKHICVKRSPTSVHSVLNRLPTRAISRNTQGFIWASNRTAVKSASGNSLNSRTCSNIFERTRVTNPTNVETPVVSRHFLSSQTCNHIHEVIKPTNPTSATRVINVLPMKTLFSSTFQSTKNRNT
jgi:hypothetical protein